MNSPILKMRDVPENLNRIGLESLVLSDELNNMASLLAKNKELPCVIYGETGSGKEEYVKLIHRRRMIAEGTIPLVAINCAHLNTDLAVSALFGHVRGSFSGADRSTRGLIEEADGGILFLDEVHALSLDAQQRLLRVLNDGSYTKLGDTKTTYSRFQVLTASTKDLDDLVESGAVLLDFRSRLTGLDIRLPPLRERKQDIQHFVSIFQKQKGIDLKPALFEELVMKCSEYYWQGNIRQLFYVLNAWYALCDGQLDVKLLPCIKTMHPPPTKETLLNKINEQHLEVIDIIEKAIFLEISLMEAMESVEKYILKNALDMHSSIRDVYEGLSISRNNLYFKRRRYGLTDTSPLLVAMCSHHKSRAHHSSTGNERLPPTQETIHKLQSRS